MPRRIVHGVLAIAATLAFLELACRLVVRGPLLARMAPISAVLPYPDRQDGFELPEPAWTLFSCFEPPFRPVPAVFQRKPPARRSLAGRTPPPQEAPPPGTLRILCLGDSCTYGTGVGPRDTYPAQLERLLRGGGRSVEVLNAGIPGHSSYNGLTLLRAQGLRYRPSVVTVCFGTNDRVSEWPWSDREMARRVSFVQAMHRWLQRSRLCWTVRYLTLRAWRRLGGGRTAASDAVVRVSVAEYRENLWAIVRASREAGAKVVLVAWPWSVHVAPPPASLKGDVSLPPYLDAMRAVAAEAGCPVIDLRDRLRVEKDPRFLYVDGTHLKREGNALVAAEIYRTIVEGGLLPAGPDPRRG